MSLTDHDNLTAGSMPEPSKAQQDEYYRLYAEIEAGWGIKPCVPYKTKSLLIHGEVVRRMKLSQK